MATPDFTTFTNITRRVYEYAYGIDNRDWALYRSIFTDEIVMDFSSYNGEVARPMQADDWVSNVKVLFTGLAATQHSMSNPLVDLLDATNARCRMYMQAEHFLVADVVGSQMRSHEFALGGFYDDTLKLTDDGWRISTVMLNVNWQRGNREIMAEAARVGALAGV